jgi:predicted DNA-binding protein
MSRKSVRRTLAMTPQMAQRLNQIASTKPRNVTEADLIREAIRRYLDEQDDLAGSRKHFQRSFRQRIDQIEEAVTFQLNVLIFLLDTDEDQLREAIIAARERGETLLAQMKAVRAIEEVND